MKKSLVLINAEDILPNPLNRILFRELTESEMSRLEHSIRTVGVVTPCVVYKNVDEKYVMISGHNRRNYVLKHEDKRYGKDLWCEVIDRPETEAEEMFVMVACNLGRGLSDTWVIKMFSQLLQIVRQLRENGENEEISQQSEYETLESNEIYGIGKYGELIKKQLAAFGVKGSSTREVLSEALRITRHQYDCLVMLYSTDYREKLYSRIKKSAKLKKDAVKEWDAEFDKIGLAVEEKELTLSAASDMVKNFITQIEALEKKKQPKPAKQEKPAAPQKKKEKDVEFEVDQVDVPTMGYSILAIDTVFEKHAVRLDNDTPMMVLDNTLLVLAEDLKTVYCITEYELTTYLQGLQGA